MSLEVLINQKFFGFKTMPLEIILGKHLHYGTIKHDQLIVGELGENTFIAYNPQSIGRGFSVTWTVNEKKTIALQLPLPSTTQDLTDFYAAVERMAEYWNAYLVVDGSKTSLDAFMSTYRDTVEFNYKTIKQLSQQILDGKYVTFVVHAAMWPLTYGEEEAALFIKNPDYYSEWLHEKQSIDAYYASPHFFGSDDGIIATFFLTHDMPTILPYKPAIPPNITDSETGKPLECKEWLVAFLIEGRDKPLGEMEYSKFLSLISESKKSKYDATHFILEGITEAGIRFFSSL